MAGSEDNDQSRSTDWPWNDQTFQNMQADHERFMSQLREEGQRLQRHIENEITPPPSDNHSPFANFKKFIDENFNTLTEGFKNFPANLAEVRGRMQREREFRQAEEDEIARRWTGSSDSPNEIRMQLGQSTPEEKEKVHEATLMLLEESLERNHHVPADKIAALFADSQSRFGDLDQFASPMLSWGGACYYKPETGDNLPSTRNWSWTSRPTPRWLSVDWFKRSPYSPVTLEAHPSTGPHGLRWRSAFEDLLNASLDKPMDSGERFGVREPHGIVQSTWHGPGLDWMLSLQCRGILPPQLPRLYNDPRGNRDTRQKSIIDLLEHGVMDRRDYSFGFSNPVERDFSELMAEVGTRSTANGASTSMVRPKTIPVPLAPTTELDLYDSHKHPRFQAQLELDFLDALKIDDVGVLVDLFHEYSQTHPDLRGLLEAAMNENTNWQDASLNWLPAVASALRNCNPIVSENTVNKAIANWADKVIGLAQGSPEELQRRDGALDRLDAILAGPYRLAAALQTTEQLEQWVERLENGVKEPTDETVVGKEASSAPPAASPPVPTSDHPKPNVLSALTTTHTTRSPDGTVTTTVVLKRRFADGSEESHESVHTEHGAGVEQPSEQDREQPEKKGWFWS